jgi:hypothetical protein
MDQFNRKPVNTRKAKCFHRHSVVHKPKFATEMYWKSRKNRAFQQQSRFENEVDHEDFLLPEPVVSKWDVARQNALRIEQEKNEFALKMFEMWDTMRPELILTEDEESALMQNIDGEHQIEEYGDVTSEEYSDLVKGLVENYVNTNDEYSLMTFFGVEPN